MSFKTYELLKFLHQQQELVAVLIYKPMKKQVEHVEKEKDK